MPGRAPAYNWVVSSQKLSREQIELVLRRAAELDARPGADERGPGGDLTVRELVRLGEEAGLGSEAVMRALTELRDGSLGLEEDSAFGKSLGPGRLIITREVPGPSGPVQRAVERFMREQLMTVRRHHGDHIEWEKAQGLWPGLARSLDFARRYAFGPVSRVETIVSPQGADKTVVTFHVDMTELRRDRLVRSLLRGSAAFAVLGLGGAALLPGFGMPDVAALFGGGAAAGGLFALERRRYEQTRERVALAPERFLDLLVQRRRRVQDRQTDAQLSSVGAPADGLSADQSEEDG